MKPDEYQHDWDLGTVVEKFFLFLRLLLFNHLWKDLEFKLIFELCNLNTGSIRDREETLGR
jgi:hypothetical protein